MTTLEKIRAEIAEIAPLDYPCDKRTPEHIRDMALDIIDKYAEQEPISPCDVVEPTKIKAMQELINESYYKGFIYGKEEGLREAEQEPTDEWQNGYDMAWEEAKVFYEQEPCDVVSRQAMLDNIKNGFHWESVNGITAETVLKQVIHDVEIMPSVQQEPKSGHWILDETDNSITCDKCGCLIWANDISNGEAYYCPSCGARMSDESV